MTVQLPISIQASKELLDKFAKLSSVSNKLEAQFNFQTLTAGWYGDEENILMIHLSLETPASFYFQKMQESAIPQDEFADDVLSYHNVAENKINCYIAITDSEIILLVQQPKLLAGFIQAKIKKILNLIANKLSFEQI
ncbi:MAG: hypothetical protein HRT52_08765 [Colwellia sp.]|nr:hypothetical protein [Colwellia sp.]